MNGLRKKSNFQSEKKKKEMIKVEIFGGQTTSDTILSFVCVLLIFDAALHIKNRDCWKCIPPFKKQIQNWDSNSNFIFLVEARHLKKMKLEFDSRVLICFLNGVIHFQKSRFFVCSAVLCLCLTRIKRHKFCYILLQDENENPWASMFTKK